MKAKRVIITIRLLPQASKLSNEKLLKEIEGPIKESIWHVPWASERLKPVVNSKSSIICAVPQPTSRSFIWSLTTEDIFKT